VSPVATSKSETRVVPGPYDRVFGAECDAARAEGMSVVTVDPSIGQIFVTTGVTLMTWGEQVSDAGRPSPDPL